MSSVPQRVTLSNAGSGLLTVSAIGVSGPFQIIDQPDLPLLLDPGESATVDVVFVPVAEGNASGTLSVTNDVSPLVQSVALSGMGVAEVVVPELSILSTLGNQIIDTETDEPVRLKSVNWFGAEGANYTPHGTWTRSYKAMIEQIASLGFNCIRLPFSGDLVIPGRMPLAIDPALNPELIGLNALQVFDKILDHCLLNGLYVVLDHHRRQAGIGADGSPVDGSYSVAQWHATWTTMASRYVTHRAVCGADLHNEPHDLTWDAWASYAEGCATAINAVAPHWLIFVEGVGTHAGESYWWGGQLKGVNTRPVVIPQANKLVYSPHEYGQSVATGQAWLDYAGSPPPAGWPNNLYAKWADVWGFIFYQGIAPIWIGEYGGKFGYAGDGTDYVTPHRDEERLWLATLSNYLNGDADGDNDNDIGVIDGLGMSHAYWSWNPNSGDTGGLLEDDWLTPQTGKLVLLADLLSDAVLPPNVAVLLVDDDDVALLDDDNVALEDG